MMKTFTARRWIAIILAVIFVTAMGMYVVSGIKSMDEQSKAAMSAKLNKSSVDIDINKANSSAVKTYILSIAFLIICYLVLSMLNMYLHMEMQGFMTALFMLISIGMSYKVLFWSFTGKSGEAVFTCASVIVAIITAVIWRNMHHELPPKLFMLLVAATLILLFMHIFAKKAEGTETRAWLRIGSLSIQLSEPIKVLMIVLGACSFRNNKRGAVYSMLCLICAAVMVLIHDLGAAAIFLIIFILMTYLLFDSKTIPIFVIVLGCISIIGFVAVNPYAMKRLGNWGNAMFNKDSFQQRDYIIMTIAGGWKGLGISEAYHYTSITASWNDGALAGIMAIYGIGMLIVTIGCYIVLVLSAAYHSSVSNSNHLLLFQIAAIIFTQVFLNYLGALDVIPFTGVNAPSISSGGSSTLMMGVLYGLMAASFYPKVKNRKLMFKEE